MCTVELTRSSHKILMQTFSLVGAAILIVVFFWQAAKANDALILALDNCVAASAKAEGYSGDVHSAEAWSLFAAGCTK